MGKHSRQKGPTRTERKVKKFAIWAAVIAVGAALVYVLSQGAGVPYDENDIVVVDFSSLTSSAKKTALQAANRARCPCTCRMTLAQCVATDSTCPVRTENIDKIKAIVAQTAPTS
jgi:hypothetical protein